MCQELEASSGALHRPGALANNLDEVVRKPALLKRRLPQERVSWQDI